MRIAGSAWIAFLGLSAQACDDRAIATRPNTTRDSAGVRIVESRAPVWGAGEAWRIADTARLSLGTVDGDPREQFTAIRGVVELSDGALVVADGASRQLRCFGADGRFRWASGRQGQGPGEYTGFSSVAAYRGDSVFVHDFAQRRFTIIGPDGSFGRTGALELAPGVTFSGALTTVGAWPDGSLAVLQQPVRSGTVPASVTRRTLTLYRYSPDGRFLQVLDSAPGTEFFESKGGAGSIAPLPFGHTTAIVPFALGTVLADNAIFQIRVTQIGGATSLFRRAFMPDTIPPARIAEERARLSREAAAFRDSAFRGMPIAMLRTIGETQTRTIATLPFPPTYPAYAGAVVGRGGQVWLELFSPQPAPAVTYSVFVPTGEWLGDVTAPPGLRVLHVADDHVVGLYTDDLGLQYVRTHALLRDRR